MVTILVNSLIVVILMVVISRASGSKGFETWPRTWRFALSTYVAMVLVLGRDLVWQGTEPTLPKILGLNLIVVTLLFVAWTAVFAVFAVFVKGGDDEHRRTAPRTLIVGLLLYAALVVLDFVRRLWPW